MEQAGSVSCRSSRTDHPGFGVGKLGPGGVPVLYEPTDAFEGAEAVVDHADGVGQGGIEGADDQHGRVRMSPAAHHGSPG